MSDSPPDGAAPAPKKPLWKRTWFIVTAIVVAILVIAGITTAATEIATIESNTAASTQTPVPSEPAIPLVTPSETPSETSSASPSGVPSSSASPSSSPSARPTTGPSAAPTPPPTAATLPSVDPARFKTAAGKNLNDFEKDLNDTTTAMSEFNNPLVVANAAELAVNARQLKAIQAPASIAGEWSAANAALSGLVTEIGVAVKAQDFATLTNLIAAGHSQVAAMRDIVARA